MKKIVAALLAGLSLFMAPAALAADPVQFSGAASIRYERDIDAKVSGTMSTIKLTGEADLGSGWGFYARLGAQHATEPEVADFNPDAYAADKKTVFGFDQFGFTYKADGLNYKLGRQDVTIGTTALLYSRSDANVGKHFFVDGLTVSGTVGRVDVSAVIAREDNPGDQADNKIYAVRTGFNPTDAWNWGVTLGRYQAKRGSDSIGSTNHWAVDGTYKFGKSSLTAEYTKSNAADDNKAYAATWNYDFDGKTSVYLTGFRVEDYGDMGQQSDFDNGNRGIHYGVSYKLNDADAVDLVYKDQKIIHGGQDNAIFEATVSHSF